VIAMALYDLVTLKRSLTQAMVVDTAVESLLDLRTSILNIKNHVPVLADEHEKYIDSLVAHYDQLIEDTVAPTVKLKATIADIDQQITKLTHKLFANNYELETFYGTVESVRNNRRIYCNQDVEEIVRQRIILHTSWKYPALEIGCRDGEWTQHLIAADPLYVIDRQQEFLDNTNKRFPKEYQTRLRKYRLADNDFSMLPKKQFGFVFSWGYFNYVSIDTMTQALKQLSELMRPGGIFMFSFNDGDTPSGAGLAENFAQTYMPKSILIPLCQSLGFDLVSDYDFTPGVSWLEIKKPGQLHTVKAHQVLGEIKPYTL
jgi:SAM-dependent methyltransferase